MQKDLNTLFSFTDMWVGTMNSCKRKHWIKNSQQLGCCSDMLFVSLLFACRFLYCALSSSQAVLTHSPPMIDCWSNCQRMLSRPSCLRYASLSCDWLLDGGGTSRSQCSTSRTAPHQRAMRKGKMDGFCDCDEQDDCPDDIFASLHIIPNCVECFRHILWVILMVKDLGLDSPVSWSQAEWHQFLITLMSQKKRHVSVLNCF